MIDKYLLSISSVLVCLIPLALLSGPFLPDLFLSIVSIIFLIISLKNNEKKYFHNTFFYFFLVFYLYLVFISIFSESAYFSLKSSVVYFRFGIFSLAVWYLLDKNKNFINNFFFIFLITFFIALLNGYYQFFNGNGIFGIQSLNPTRLTLLLNDRMLLGNYLSRLFPLLLALFIFRVSKYENYSIVLILFLSFIMMTTDILIYISGERTGLGLMAIATLLLVILLSKFRKIRLISVILSLIIIIGITLTNREVKDRNITFTLNQMGLSQNEGSRSIYYLSQQHEAHIKSAFLMFKEAPLLGVGPNMFRKYCSNEKFKVSFNSCSTHPHNIYIQLLSEAGILGSLFILIVILYVSYQIIVKFKEKIYGNTNKFSDYQICLLICFLLTLFPFLPSLNFFNNWINTIYYLPVGFYLQLIYSTPKIKSYVESKKI